MGKVRRKAKQSLPPRRQSVEALTQVLCRDRVALSIIAHGGSGHPRSRQSSVTRRQAAVSAALPSHLAPSPVISGLSPEDLITSLGSQSQGSLSGSQILSRVPSPLIQPLPGGSTSWALQSYPAGRSKQRDSVTQTCTGHSDRDTGRGQCHATRPGHPDCHETQTGGVIHTTWSHAAVS